MVIIGRMNVCSCAQVQSVVVIDVDASGPKPKKVKSSTVTAQSLIDMESKAAKHNKFKSACCRYCTVSN